MRHLVWIIIGVATVSLALGYAASTSLVLGLAALGFLWMFGHGRGWGWTSSVGLIVFVSMAAFGLWRGASPLWMFFAVVATLVAWDLDHFSHRLRYAPEEAEARGLLWSHTRRMAAVAGVGLLLGGIALSAQVSLSFGWALLLGFLSIWGLSRAFRVLRQSEGSRDFSSFYQ